jgi:hypothetical protein
MPLRPPGDDELAAIIAAVELAWPRPAASDGAATGAPPAWRWSGRWWTGPVARRRQRPWA